MELKKFEEAIAWLKHEKEICHCHSVGLPLQCSNCDRRDTLISFAQLALKLQDAMPKKKEKWVGITTKVEGKIEGFNDCHDELIAFWTGKLAKEKLARFMHDTYERLAKEVGWKTQECCQTPWETLPTANQQVMLGLAEAIHTHFGGGK